MVSMQHSSDLTLVLGGTGKTGRRVADQLTALGHPVRIGSRGGQPRFDWDDPAGWPAALDGVTAVYITYQPDLAFPGAAEAIGAFTRLAVDGGVQRLVLLSGRGEEGAWPAERAVRDAGDAVGAAWTVLRASWFAQNFSEHFLLGPVLDGVIALPAGDVAEPFIDVDDVAAVAVAALTSPDHHGMTYELTGPRSLTFADVAAELSSALGGDVAYLAVTPEEYAAGAVAAGVPEDEVGPLTELFTKVLDGRNAHVTGDVEAVLGRPAGDFAAYARMAAAAGVWSLPAVDGSVDALQEAG